MGYKKLILNHRTIASLRDKKRQFELNCLLQTWNLSNPELIPNQGYTSNVYKVLQRDGTPVVLKHFRGTSARRNEARGADMLRYYGTDNAVEVLQKSKYAVLLEYIDGEELTKLLAEGHDEQVVHIICDLFKKIHQAKAGHPPSKLNSMEDVFSDMLSVHDLHYDSLLLDARDVLRSLLESSEKNIVLHGDMHPSNIMKSREREWLAIDPKGIEGEPCFDIAMAFPISFQKLSEGDERKRLSRLTKMFSEMTGETVQRIAQFHFVSKVNTVLWGGGGIERTAQAYQTAQTLRKMI